MFGKKKKEEHQHHILTPEEIDQMHTDWGENWGKEVPNLWNVPDEPPGTVMSEETKQRILREAGWHNSGSPYPAYYGTTGTNYVRDAYGMTRADRVPVDSMDIDALWEKMYVKMRKVIVVCSYCGRPTVISEGNCPKCGAPLPVEFL